MLPKPKFDANPRPTISVNTNPLPQNSGQNWFQYNPNQSLNQRFVNNYSNYGQNYSNYNNNSFGNNFQSILWHQNNYNSTNNLNVNNVWNGFNNQNNIRFNQKPYNNYGQQHNQRYDHQNKRLNDKNQKILDNNNSNNKSYNCDSCNRWFKNEELFNQHLSEHILCGLDECTFRAHPKVIESHQRMQHFCFRDKSLVKKFMGLDTEEDIKKWKEERKRNFPTKDNIKKKIELKEKQRLEAIEQKNRLNETKEDIKQNNKRGFDRQKDNKSKKNMKFRGKDRPKPMTSITSNRKLTLFQKLMMNEIQENEEKITEKVGQ